MESEIGDLSKSKFAGKKYRLPISFKSKAQKDSLQRYIETQRPYASYLPDPMAFVAKNNGFTDQQLRDIFVKSSLTYDDTAEEDDSEEEEEDEEAAKELLEGKADKAYQRVRVMIEGLLESGRRALESKPEDFVGSGKGGAKVLTAEEVRNWRGDDNDTETRSMLDVDASPSSSRPLTPSRVAVPDSDDGLGSEDEVEATLDEPDARPAAPLPPITITPSASP